jgi:hypothetical protein
VINGATAEDGSYLKDTLDLGFYTEDIVPVLGWKNMGKMLVLSGTEGKLTENIYLRNPQSSDINVIALIGR